jgi:hypothetical protein
MAPPRVLLTPLPPPPGPLLLLLSLFMSLLLLSLFMALLLLSLFMALLLLSLFMALLLLSLSGPPAATTSDGLMGGELQDGRGVTTSVVECSWLTQGGEPLPQCEQGGLVLRALPLLPRGKVGCSAAAGCGRASCAAHVTSPSSSAAAADTASACMSCTGGGPPAIRPAALPTPEVAAAEAAGAAGAGAHGVVAGSMTMPRRAKSWM